MRVLVFFYSKRQPRFPGARPRGSALPACPPSLPPSLHRPARPGLSLPAAQSGRQRSPTSLVLVDAQRHGDALEGPLVTGPHSLGRPAGLGRVAGPAALGGHEGAAGEALAEPGEEQPELEGDKAEQGEGGEKRVREVVQVPLVGGRRCRRPRGRHFGGRPGRRGG